MSRMISIATIMFMGITSGILVARLSLSFDAILIWMLGLTLVIPIVMRAFQRRFDPFEPLVIFALAYGAMFVIRPVAMLSSDTLHLDAWYRIINLDDTFTEMVTLALVGAVSFVVGYELTAGRRLARFLPEPPEDFHTDTLVTGALLIAGLGIVLYVSFLASTGATISSSFRDPEQLALFQGRAYLTHGIFFLVPSTLMIICVGDWRHNNWIRLTGVGIALVFLALMLPAGNRLSVLPLVTGLVVYLYARQNKRPRFFALSTLAVLALLTSSVLRTLRTPHLRESATAQGVILDTLHHPEELFAPITSGADNGMADLFATALQIIPEETPFQYGRDTIADLFLRPIPRAFWPEKPLTPVQQTVETLWPRAFADGIANPEFSVLLAFYRDFGLLGIVMGMAGFGILARALYEYYLAYKTNILVILILGVNLSFIVLGVRDNPVDNLWRWVPMVIPLWMVFQIAGRKTSSQRHRQTNFSGSLPLRHPEPNEMST